MKKLINVINTKVLQGSNRLKQNQSQQTQKAPSIKKIIQTLPNRKNKAKKKIQLTDFRFYNKQIAPFCSLARSNFQCNQFSIVTNKKNKNKSIEVQAKLQEKLEYDQIEKDQKHQTHEDMYQKQQQLSGSSFQSQIKCSQQSALQQKFHEQTVDKLQKPSQLLQYQCFIPQQIRLRFKNLIQQINNELNDLYFHKKNLYQQPAFQININFTLFLLLLFMFIVIVLISLEDSYVYSQDYKLNQQYSNFLLLLTIFIITLLYFINIIYCYYQKYQYFSFDLQVMKKISLKLMIENQSFFRLNQYTITSDIQTTWILLKPISINKKIKKIKIQN